MYVKTGEEKTPVCTGRVYGPSRRLVRTDGPYTRAVLTGRAEKVEIVEHFGKTGVDGPSRRVVRTDNPCERAVWTGILHYVYLFNIMIKNYVRCYTFYAVIIGPTSLLKSC